jgi:hypothetical protein
MVVSPGSKRQIGLSVPGSRRLLWHSGGVLSEMRNSRGGPNWGMRLLAIVLALLLAGPLTVLVLQGALRVLDAAL